jgi:AmmeMemoRadiSam system protein A
LLREAERLLLLMIARDAATARARGEPLPSPSVPQGALRLPGDAFVTVRVAGQLRGCIGFVRSRDPLWENVREAAARAASEDTRFEAVRADELQALSVQVSLLTPPRRANAEAVVVGTHGLSIRGRGRSGLLLPQVAREHGLDRIGFLEAVCEKAGLPKDAWRDADVELCVFEADVFGTA